MKKVLFISSKVLPSISGDAIYTYGNILRLSKLATIDLITYYNEDFENEKEYIELVNTVNKLILVKRLFKSTFIEKFKSYNSNEYSNSFEHELIQILNTYSYDIVIIDHLRMSYTYKIIKKYIKDKKTKIIHVEHNVEYINIKESIKFEINLYKKIKILLKNISIKSYEFNLIKKVDYVWFISKDDYNVIEKKMYNLESKSIIVTPYYPFERIKFETDLEISKYRLIITGSMSWYPNVEGVTWFIKNVFNILLENEPRFELYIVGNRPHKNIRDLSSNNVIVTGRVPSTDEYLKKSDILVVPNRLGTGTKIKILEGILKGIPIIVTKESSKGYDGTMFSKEFIANNPKEFINKIINIINDSELKKKFIENAQKKIINEKNTVNNELSHFFNRF